MIEIIYLPYHRNTRVYPLLFIPIHHATILNGAVINPISETFRIPRKFFRIRLRVNQLAPTVVDLHFQADEIALQLRYKGIVEAISVGCNHVGDNNLARPTIKMDGVVGGVALGLQTAVLRCAIPVVVNRDLQGIRVLEGG